MRRPETNYVAVGDADVAYQVIGEGASDLLLFAGLGSNVEMGWDEPANADLLKNLASLRRVIVFDRRGTGASDGVPRSNLPTWEEWTDDIGAVLDAVGSTRAAILANVDAGPISILYTVAHPERVDALVLCNTAATYLASDDYPIGARLEDFEGILDIMRARWGTSEYIHLTTPSLVNDPVRSALLARILRLGATPRTAAAQYDYILRNLDVRPMLSLIGTPTLVLAMDSPLLSVAHGRYLADHIAESKFVPLPDVGFNLGVHGKVLFEEIAEFLTGVRRAMEIDRVLASVLFTDIAGSTALAASLGDQRWHAVLDEHDRVVREQLVRFRGREINTTGDGFVVSFDGPARAIRFGQAIIEATQPLDLELRMGLHTGECEARGDDLGGLAVHIAARVGSLAAPGEVLVSSTVKDLVVGSGIEFDHRGEHVLKGVPGTWNLFAATR